MPAETDGRRANLVALGVGQAVRLGAGMAVNVVLMRWLGVEGFGVYAYVSTLVAVAAFASHLGLHRLLVREVARDHALAGRFVAGGVAASAAASIATGAALVAWAHLADGRPEVVGAAILGAAALGLRSVAMIVGSAFHAVRDMKLGVPADVAGRAVLLASTVALLAAGLEVRAVFAAQVLDGLATVAVLAWMYRRRFGGLPRVASAREVVILARRAFPFSLNFFFGSVYMAADVLLLAHLRGDAEVGAYRAAALLINLIPVLAETLSTGIYPRMSAHRGDRAAAGRELGFAARILLAVSVPMAVGGILLADRLMVFLGGAEYLPSALPFVIMAPMLPLRFLNNGFGMTLSALDRQDERTRGVFVAAVFNVAANLVAIPAWGAVGAAVTTLFTDLLLTIWLGVRVRPVVERAFLGQALVRTAAPAVPMAVALVLLPPVHVLVAVLAGAAVYGAAGLAAGALRRSDLRLLWRV